MFQYNYLSLTVYISEQNKVLKLLLSKYFNNKHSVQQVLNKQLNHNKLY